MTTFIRPSQLEGLKNAYAAGGIRSFWRAHLDMLSRSENPNAYLMAQYQTRLGNTDEALKWFLRAAEIKQFDFIYFNADPIHGEFANDRRFLALAKFFDQ